MQFYTPISGFKFLINIKIFLHRITWQQMTKTYTSIISINYVFRKPGGWLHDVIIMKISYLFSSENLSL